MKKMLLAVLCGLFIFSSCKNQDLNSDIPKVNPANRINAQLISPVSTRSGVSNDEFTSGYLCTSQTSPLKTEVLVNKNNQEAYTYMLDENGNVVNTMKFKINSFISEGICTFTASDENGEPIMSGVYDTVNNKMKITDIYAKGIATRKASLGNWGCGLCIGIVGGIWSTAAGMVSAGAGFVVGMAYTAMAIGMCS